MNDIPLVLATQADANDGIMLRLAFERAKIRNPLVILSEGREVMDYISGSAPYWDRTRHPFPSLLLLDLKMARMDGFEVLIWLAARTYFRELPAVCLSSSSDRADSQRAMRLGARDCFVKPNGLERWVEIVNPLHAGWLAPRMPKIRPVHSATPNPLARSW